MHDPVIPDVPHKTFLRSEFYEETHGDPEKVILTMVIEDKPLAWLSFNKPQLEGLIETLTDMKNKFHG